MRRVLRLLAWASAFLLSLALACLLLGLPGDPPRERMQAHHAYEPFTIEVAVRDK